MTKSHTPDSAACRLAFVLLITLSTLPGIRVAIGGGVFCNYQSLLSITNLVALDPDDPELPYPLFMEFNGHFLFTSGLFYELDDPNDQYNYLQIFDISTPSSPQLLHNIFLDPDEAIDLVVTENAAYIATESRERLSIINLNEVSLRGSRHPSRPARDMQDTEAHIPKPNQSIPITQIPVDMRNAVLKISGDQLFVFRGSHQSVADEIEIFNLTNPMDPQSVGVIDLNQISFNIRPRDYYTKMHDGVVYSVNDNRLFVYDLSDSNNPQILTDTTMSENYRFEDPKLDPQNELIYVMDSRHRDLLTIDLSDLQYPEVVSAVEYSPHHLSWSIEGTIGYQLIEHVMRAIDLSDPRNPTYTGHSIDVYASHQSLTTGPYIHNNIMWHTNYLQGLVAIDLSNPPYRTDIELGRFRTTAFTSVAVRDNICYTIMQNGRFITADITDPANPIELGHAVGLSGTNLRLCLHDNLAYIATDSGGLKIVDVSDPTNPTLIFEEGSPASRLWDLVVRDGYLFAAGYQELTVFDLDDPRNPVLIWQASDNPRHSYSITLDGNFAYLSGYALRGGKYDISDPTNPIKVGYTATGNDGRDLVVRDGFGYLVENGNGLTIWDATVDEWWEPISHFHTPDWSRDIKLVGDLAYISDGEAGLVIVDISNPYEPKLAGSHRIFRPDSFQYAAFVWETVVDGNTAYLATDYGLAILDISDCPPPCTADLTNDGVLDVFDTFAFLDAYALQDPTADFNNDSLFDIFDVFAFLEAFNAGCT